MGIVLKIILGVSGLGFFIFVFLFVKKNSFRPSYAVLWIFISLFLISIPFFESFYSWISYTVLSFADARHLIYMVLIGFLLIYIFYLTTKISRMSDQIQQLISYTAIIKAEKKEKNT